jgi:hypothetical protein
MKIKIDNETLKVDKVYNGVYLPLLKCGKLEFYVAKDSESAGEAARKYWEDVANNDPAEFACLIGEERLVQWAIGQGDSFGISAFGEFLDKVAEHPEAEFAHYDGQERDCEIVPDWTDEPEPDFYECGICDQYHKWSFEGDCRETDGGLTKEQCYEQGPDTVILDQDDKQAREEWTIETSELYDELGFVPTVAYRHN